MTTLTDQDAPSDEMKAAVEQLSEALKSIYNAGAPAFFSHLPVDKVAEIGKAAASHTVGVRFILDFGLGNRLNISCYMFDEASTTRLFEFAWLTDLATAKPFLVKKAGC